ncbi:class I SAM-dependent methyltransferase [Halochromatium glycolicum]|uniref:Methyltransferase type 11 domain-containing protein n=1 Tax=Halochromatium glycolicum TaxID=85075 RepID=A0AAJ0U8U8_9GAMM|nr:class I SAM-dependent methyltransferase [Halochromatium glycolicum]MBK1707357.1 hypothetical protein [Halochromatium glycolicum]
MITLRLGQVPAHGRRRTSAWAQAGGRAAIAGSGPVNGYPYICPTLKSQSVYELSCRGSLFRFLQHHSNSVTCSEYFDDVVPGEYKNAAQCQDVQKLTYLDESFDICTSTEVFEHVPNDSLGFAEICRVLKSTGVFVFTVPIDLNNITIERATPLPQGGVHHLLPAEYHGDPLCKDNKILAYRNYGADILDRLLDSGFKRAEIRSPRNSIPWGYSRPIIVGYREDASNNWLNSDPLLLRFASQ